MARHRCLCFLWNVRFRLTCRFSLIRFQAENVQNVCLICDAFNAVGHLITIHFSNQFPLWTFLFSRGTTLPGAVLTPPPSLIGRCDDDVCVLLWGHGWIWLFLLQEFNKVQCKTFGGAERRRVVQKCNKNTFGEINEQKETSLFSSVWRDKLECWLNLSLGNQILESAKKVWFHGWSVQKLWTKWNFYFRKCLSIIKKILLTKRASNVINLTFYQTS